MKLLVPSGTLLHDNCGEIFSPTQFGLLSRLARLSATCFPLIISRWQTAATFTTTHSRQKILKKRLPWRRVQDALRSVPRAVDQRPLLDPTGARICEPRVSQTAVDQFLVLSTSARSLIHGIMSRSLAPTCSIGCAAHLARIALNEIWL